jgi:hydroxymethylpyrimidine pyrophosphatase-like HAD family hydrolase
MRGPMNNICFDFDGTLAEYDSWRGHGKFGELDPRAIRLLRNLANRGFRIVVLTARKETEFIKTYLDKNKVKVAEVTNVKPIALAYIDDRAVEWKGDAGKALERVLELVKKKL